MDLKALVNEVSYGLLHVVQVSTGTNNLYPFFDGLTSSIIPASQKIGEDEAKEYSYKFRVFIWSASGVTDFLTEEEKKLTIHQQDRH